MKFLYNQIVSWFSKVKPIDIRAIAKKIVLAFQLEPVVKFHRVGQLELYEDNDKWLHYVDSEGKESTGITFRDKNNDFQIFIGITYKRDPNTEALSAYTDVTYGKVVVPPGSPATFGLQGLTQVRQQGKYSEIFKEQEFNKMPRELVRMAYALIDKYHKDDDDFDFEEPTEPVPPDLQRETTFSQ